MKAIAITTTGEQLPIKSIFDNNGRSMKVTAGSVDYLMTKQTGKLPIIYTGGTMPGTACVGFQGVIQCKQIERVHITRW